jgi:hypothetical protein
MSAKTFVAYFLVSASKRDALQLCCNPVVLLIVRPQTTIQCTTLRHEVRARAHHLIKDI